MYTFSERTAWVAGVVLPVGETLRRWGTWWDHPPAYLDDIVLGVFLLVGATMSRRDRHAGQPYLASAWGFACGIGLMSLATNISLMAAPDPSGVSGTTAVAIKAFMMALGFAALAGALRRPQDSSRQGRAES